MERWGKEFRDNRNWKVYNEELVVRGEFLLELSWVTSWESELEAMNKGKRGAPLEFPKSLIELQAVWHQSVDYRGVEGITRKLHEHGLVPEFNDFSTINRRARKLDLDFELPRKGNVNVSCDGSGMKMTNSGEYKQDMYGKESRKWIRVKIAADPVTRRMLACDVCIDGEGSSEPKTAEEQINRLLTDVNINKFWGDGGYYALDLFNLCQNNGMETAIKIPINASPKAYGSMRKAREAKKYQAKGYRKWANEKEYGMRWVGTEGIFSAVKRKFGENKRSRKIGNIFHEAKTKFWAYQVTKDYAELRMS